MYLCMYLDTSMHVSRTSKQALQDQNSNMENVGLYHRESMDCVFRTILSRFEVLEKQLQRRMRFQPSTLADLLHFVAT